MPSEEIVESFGIEVVDLGKTRSMGVMPDTEFWAAQTVPENELTIRAQLK